MFGEPKPDPSLPVPVRRIALPFALLVLLATATRAEPTLSAEAEVFPGAVVAPDEGALTVETRVLTIVQGGDVRIEDFLWKARPVIVFADSEADPAFRQQMRAIREGAELLADRDVVIIIDTDPTADSALRKRFRPRGFTLVLVAKDGTIVRRRPIPWDAREIARTIDKLPIRREELRARSRR